MIFWMWLYVYAVYKTRLIFDDQGVRLESIKRFSFLLRGGLRPFVSPYDQIKNVKSNGFIGMLTITNIYGKKVAIIPALFGKNYGEEILIELRNHLPAEKFESGMNISETRQKWLKTNKSRNVFVISFWVIYILSFLLDPMFSSRSWMTNAWKVELHPIWFEDVWTYSLDSANQFWVVSWKTSEYRVYHFSDKVDKEWALPKRLLGRNYPQLVSQDKNGNPIVWIENSVFYYRDGTWENIPYRNNLDLGDWDERGIVKGEQGWAITKQDTGKQFIKINAFDGKWSVLPLPETAKTQKLLPQSIHQAVNGDFLVLMQSDTASRVYLLSNDNWLPQEYPVIVPDSSRVRDYFLDSSNSLWVLFESQNEFIVEKINTPGDLHLTQLPSPKETDEWERYDSIIVDSSGRLWVGGGYPDFMAVFNPVWDDTSIETIRYTTENSNYQGTGLKSPIILPNGEIWSFHRMITTLDTNLMVLPSPLPDWLALRDWSLIRVYLMLTLLLIYLLFYILSVLKNPFKKVTERTKK
jgi:hypothetical protein